MSREPRDLTLVKLGGSLLTDKRGRARARPEVIERLAGEVMAAREAGCGPLVVGHGSGSFGHVAAAEAGLGRGPVAADAAAGVSLTQRQAARLHRLVVDALAGAGLATFSWAPSSALTASEGRRLTGAVEPLARALEIGLLPAVYGDVVADRAWGAAIASTEAVFTFLAARLPRHGWRVRRIFWLGETAGVYGRDGRTLETIDAAGYRRALAAARGAAGTDVTGGMRLRLRTARRLARRGVESWIVDGRVPGLLAAALSGEEVPGTRVVAEPG